MYVYSNTEASLLYVETSEPLGDYHIFDAEGNEMECPLMLSKQKEKGILCTLDASSLSLWTLDAPVLYTLKAQGEEIRFGHTSIAPMQNKAILLNGSPVYLRGYIRGIVAHDHPNMTGGSDYEAALKNIRQAKKYGFNLVRFHSTIPSEDFVRAADELGLRYDLQCHHLPYGLVAPQAAGGSAQSAVMRICPGLFLIKSFAGLYASNRCSPLLHQEVDSHEASGSHCQGARIRSAQPCL